MVTSMLRTPPSNSASVKGINTSAEGARMTATTHSTLGHFTQGCFFIHRSAIVWIPIDPTTFSMINFQRPDD
ncbi:MAG: hypothetical protein KatS3mg104_1739 [Phycisphaerae bacterium]|nr:MAG: hypothetical protein KatS3mg104_1739 [Phycisphaerae bacterium]